MNKKMISAFAAAAVLLTAGCGTPAQTAAPADAATAAPTETTDAPQKEIADAAEAPETAPADDIGVGEQIMSMRLSVEGSGKLNITRAADKSTPMGDKNTWTIFVYLCGSDLESKYNAATADLAQMIQSSANDNVKFVVECGGSPEWYENIVPADKLSRWVIKDGDMFPVGEAPQANMGDKQTLVDFLQWGITNYPADKMGVVFWDHGGGSISGACFDEVYNKGYMDLAGFNDALSEVYKDMTDKFEFIGYDCCLMGTLETANIMANYARYFYGSQETEPGSGWDYTTIGTFLAENTNATGAELGKVVADSFYEECKAGEQEAQMTFSIVDLTKFDSLLTAFNDYSKELYEIAQNNDLAEIVRAVGKADNFGGNNKSEGYTNMVDLGGIIEQCSDYADGSAVLSALDDCLVYNINGTDHSNASGLSVYYPLQIQGSAELKTFAGITTSPYYLSLVDMIATGYTDNGYSNEVFFTEDGMWVSDAEGNEEYFDYADEESDGISELIDFEIEPSMDEDGMFGFALTPDSLDYTAAVSAQVYYDLEDGLWADLGQTYDINADWENGLFIDNFDGYWLAMPDGVYLATYIVGVDEDSVLYTSPIMLNEERTNLRIRMTDEGCIIEGAWDGIDENGLAARDIRKLKVGDVIAPVYYFEDDETGEEIEYPISEYIWQDGDNVIYNTLLDGRYAYSFDIEDIYGDHYYTDYAYFGIDDEGNITFE